MLAGVLGREGHLADLARDTLCDDLLRRPRAVHLDADDLGETTARDAVGRPLGAVDVGGAVGGDHQRVLGKVLDEALLGAFVQVERHGAEGVGRETQERQCRQEASHHGGVGGERGERGVSSSERRENKGGRQRTRRDTYAAPTNKASAAALSIPPSFLPCLVARSVAARSCPRDKPRRAIISSISVPPPPLSH